MRVNCRRSAGNSQQQRSEHMQKLCDLRLPPGLWCEVTTFGLLQRRFPLVLDQRFGIVCKFVHCSS